MPCKDCMYWEPIGNVNTVVQYKQKHKEVPETVFAEFVVEDKDTHFYGRCMYNKYACIKAAEASCLKFATKQSNDC